MRFDRYRTGHSGKDHKEGDKPGAGNLHDLGRISLIRLYNYLGFPKLYLQMYLPCATI